jgi:DNA replication protein DnaC
MTRGSLEHLAPSISIRVSRRAKGDRPILRHYYWRGDIVNVAAAFGHALIENGYRVLFTRTTDLVQRLQQARQALSLESTIEKLDKYHVLILEDLCYVRKDQAETSVLFELIAARFERRSLIVTANHPFGEWTSAAMTLAAVDRLVHHSTIFEMNVESYRRRVAAARTPRKPRGISDSRSDSEKP